MAKCYLVGTDMKFYLVSSKDSADLLYLSVIAQPLAHLP